ncbi:Uncharacterised protein [Bordetella pertussis]|nr:Uncharacterised protein [Bordetella pertussis]CFO74430.1 Uncharacterised protein [Bordetella pertussis]CFU83796.1 Uncharacterised protein [Bordetella pertussis]CPI14581.1 Uncharacterised protein [Bordetella pertussis]CPK63803.1 Uncharacterised protein [Bordetella pertussis]
MSSSYHLAENLAEVPCAWWLLCSSSPPMMMPHGNTLVLVSGLL